jgi:PAS domain S-box-containing protein
MSPQENLDAFSNSGDGVFIVDSSQRVVRWNAGAERILGFAASECIGQPCYQLIAGRTQGDGPWCQPGCKVQECVSCNIPLENFEIMTRSKSGGALWLNVSVLSPSDGGAPVSVHLFRDVTRERQTADAIEQFLIALGIFAGSKEKPAEKGRVRNTQGRPAVSLPKTLSARELEVLRLLAEGLSTRTVAERLNISHYTARNHIQNILTKLELHSKAQAVSFAYRKRLI